MITVTDSAKQKFTEISTAEGREGHGLRIIVQGGGTAQPGFALNFVAPDEASPQDTAFDTGGLTVYADADSAKWLEGASIDFVERLGEAGFKVDAPNAGVPVPEGPIAEAVQRVIDEKINPAVASHGGRVALVAIEGETAYLQFGGGCQGCGMAKATLKNGVEKTLLEDVPQITRVMDVTDHAAGTNPYYQPAE